MKERSEKLILELHPTLLSARVAEMNYGRAIGIGVTFKSTLIRKAFMGATLGIAMRALADFISQYPDGRRNG